MGAKKILLTVLSSILLLVAGVSFYFYTRPEAAISILERAVSRFAGVSIDIRRLTGSFSPLRISAEGIVITPASDASGSSLKISELDAHMVLEGSFGNRRLVVESLRVGGFSLTYHHNEFQPIPEKKPSVSVGQPILLRIAAFLFFKELRMQDLILTDGEALAHIDDATLTAEKINARRSPDQRIEISADTLFQWPSENTAVRIPDLRLSLEDAVSLSDPVAKGRVRANRIRLEHPELTLSNLNLDIEGQVDVSKRQLKAPLVKASMGKDLQLTGALTARGGSEPGAVLAVREASFFPEKILALLPESVKRGLSSAHLRGSVSAGGSVEIVKRAAGWTWTGDVDFRLSDNPFSYAGGKGRLHGRISGAVAVKGDPADVTLSGDVTVAPARYSDPKVSADLSEAKFSLSGTLPVLRVENASAHLSRINGMPSIPGVPWEDIRLVMTEGVFDLTASTAKLSGIRLQPTLIQNLAADVTADEHTVRIRIHGEKTGLLEAVRGRNLLPPGWRMQGDDDLSIDASLKPPDTLSFTAGLRIDRLRFQDPDARLMGENVGLDVRLTAELNLSDGAAAGSAACRLTEGEVLYDLYYIDLNAHPFSAAGESVFRPLERSVTIEHLNLALENVISMRLTGDLTLQHPLRGRLSLDIPPAPAGPLFTLFVAEPLQSKKPHLSGLAVSGRVSTGLTLAHTAGGWSVTGRLHWQDGSLRVKDTLDLEDIRMDLPIRHHPENGPSDEPPLAGSVSIGKLNIPPLPEQRIDFLIRATPDRLSIPTPPKIRIPGGNVQLGPVTIEDPFSGIPSVRTAVTVHPTDLAPLLASAWPGMPESLVSGTLDPVILGGDRIETRGTLTWDGFGGRIILSDLGLDRFLSAGPLIRASAELDGLDLGRLTAGTAFGRVDGILNGFIRNLEVAYGQPQAFDLLLETERTKGVPQKISITAVDNIARIGGGQSPFMGLAGAFTSLFETLNYEKIGIRASLENDLFQINGTVMDQGREYLMKGGILAGVNIINQNPDNRIRFKDMVKRLRRATSADGKPVIR